MCTFEFMFIYENMYVEPREHLHFVLREMYLQHHSYQPSSHGLPMDWLLCEIIRERARERETNKEKDKEKERKRKRTSLPFVLFECQKKKHWP